MVKNKRFNSILTLAIICSLFLSYLGYTGIVAASVLFQDGFETGNLNAWGWYGSGTPSVVSSPVYSGSFAAQATGPAYWSEKLNTGYSDLFFSGYIQMPSKPINAQAFVLEIDDSAYSNYVKGGLNIDYGGNNQWLLVVNGNWFYSTSFSFQTNHWYYMEIEYNTAGTANLYVDGALVASATGQTLLNNAQIVQGGNTMSSTPTNFVSYGDNCQVTTEYSGGTLPTATPSPTPIGQTPTPTPYGITPTPTLVPGETPSPTPIGQTPTPTPYSFPTPTEEPKYILGYGFSNTDLLIILLAIVMIMGCGVYVAHSINSSNKSKHNRKSK